MNGNIAPMENETLNFTESSTEKLVALSQVMSVVKDSFISEIAQKDRIIQKCADAIEVELDNITN